MKRIILLIAFIFIIISINAQSINDPGFESWKLDSIPGSKGGSVLNPSYWTTNNIDLKSYGLVTRVTQNPHGGMYSIQLKPSSGKPASIFQKQIINQKSLFLNGYFKSNLSSSDSFIIIVKYLHKQTNEYYEDIQLTKITVTNWTAFNIPINLPNSFTPNYFYLTAYVRGSNNAYGMLDDLSFSNNPIGNEFGTKIGYQPLLNNSNIWNYKQADLGGSFMYDYKILKDTIINSNSYKILLYTSPNSIHKYLLREDLITQRVFILTNKGEQLLYDFKANISSTLNIFGDLYTLTKVDTILTKSGYRKRLVYKIGSMEEYILEGIGSIDDLILLFDGGGDPTYNLECFYSDSHLAYSRNGANCSSQLGNETAKLNFIKIYPTVVTNELNILNAENYTYEVINYLGQVLLQGQIESQHETVMLKDIMKGTFIIRLKLSNRITKHYKFVVE